MNAPDHLVCAYLGLTDECVSCGGWVPHHRRGPGMPLCSDDCAAAHQDVIDRQDAAMEERRRREDAFAACSETLRGLGYTGEEIDKMLVGIPT